MRTIEPVSPYLQRIPRSLHDACRDIGRDLGGRACATCPVTDLCEAGRLPESSEPFGVLAESKPLAGSASASRFGGMKKALSYFG